MSGEESKAPTSPQEPPWWPRRPGFLANILTILAAIFAILQRILTAYEFLSKPVAILSAILPYVVISALALGIGVALYTIRRPGSSARQSRYAMASLGILALAGLGWGGWQVYEASQPPKGVLVMIADFDGSAATRSVAYDRQIYERVSAELVRLGLDEEVELRRVFEAYSDSAAARAAGESRKATLVIWGWYDDAGVSPHFELLRTLTPFAASLGEVSYLQNFDLNITGSSQEMAYITTIAVGLIYYAEGDYPNAISLFDSAIEIAPEETSTVGLDIPYFYKASSLFYQGADTQLVVKNLQKALEINPDLYEAHHNLALAYTQVCDPTPRLDLPLEEAKTAQSLKPDNPGAYDILGIIYFARQEWEEAVAAYEQAVALEPQNYYFHLSLAQAYQNVGREDDAQSEFVTAEELVKEEIAASSEDTADPHIQLGDTYYYQGRYEEALTEYEQALSLRPDDGQIYLDLGFTYLALDQGDDALTNFERAVELNPGNYIAHNALAGVLQGDGQWERAEAEYQETLRLHSCAIDAHLGLGGIYFVQGDLENALLHFQKVIEFEPENPLAYLELGLTYETLGDEEAAREAYLKAIEFAAGNEDIIALAEEGLARLSGE
ncbi:MAG: tetratricopeptide repeat protein [Chloroflexi bacterium]|nr:tetratricopeptide repeat protein [Chloroflexota bacterium]